MKLKRFNMVLWMLMFVIVSIVFFQMEIKAANVTNSSVKILIGDGTNSRHHLSLPLDVISDELHYEVKGYEVKSSSYSSSDPDVFVIQNTGNGQSRSSFSGDRSCYTDNSHKRREKINRKGFCICI